jgi:tyrosyl-tRNA synthetase
MDMTNVTFLWSSEEINKHSNEYWMQVIDIARRNTLTRIIR